MRLSFSEHPAVVGESYGCHLIHALEFSLRMIAGGLAVAVHAFLPFLFMRTGSNVIASLHNDMITNRIRLTEFRQAAALSVAKLQKASNIRESPSDNGRIHFC
jgi:hypothetical protein